jgi:hypothetical protein
MRLFQLLITASFLFILSCDDHDDGEEAYATFLDCYDEHRVEEQRDVIDSIKICCISHPLGDLEANVACGETAAECVDFIEAEVVDDPEALPEDIATACDEYIVERDL